MDPPEPGGNEGESELTGDGHRWEEVEAALRDEAAATAISEGASRRSRRFWLRHQGEQDASWSATLESLLEPGSYVSLGTEAGTTHRGQVIQRLDGWTAIDKTGQASVGEPVLHSLLLCLGHISWIRQERPAPPPSGPHRLWSIAAALGLAAEERLGVIIRYGPSAIPVRGRLLSAASDLLALDCDDEGTLYVWLGSVREISVFDSG